jgi:Ca-activated chloride channel family protein
MNYTFAYPWVLALLLLVPLLAALFFVPRLKRRQTGTFVFSRVSALKQQSRGWRRYLEPLPDLLVLVAITLMIVALARPQAIEAEEVEVEGIDIYLALDMSGSMQAIDKNEQEINEMVARSEEPSNRFVSAVGVLKDFVRSRQYDRIGMVVFAKDAFLQFPLTLDYNTIEGMLERLKLGDIDAGGTAIGNAIGRAVAGLKDSETKTKILILITDGDRRGGNISPMQAAQIARDLDVKVFPILVGRDGPSLVPVRMRSLFGVETRYQEQKFPIDPELLENIAQRTDGEFYRATDAQGLEERIHTILDRFERTRIKDASNVDKTELFRPMVVWAIFLIALQLMLRHTLLRKFP